MGFKNQRANSAGALQQSLHKRRGLCNDCGFVLRNFSKAHPDASNVTESYCTELKHTLSVETENGRGGEKKTAQTVALR